MRYSALAQLFRAAIAMVVLFGLAGAAFQTPRDEARADDSNPSLILWVREVNRHEVYWVGDKSVGRDSLGGLTRAIGTADPAHVELTVILDSRLPLDEISEIDGMLDKIPISHVRYFVFWVDHPDSMREILPKAEFTPTPQSNPQGTVSR